MVVFIWAATSNQNKYSWRHHCHRLKKDMEVQLVNESNIMVRIWTVWSPINWYVLFISLFIISLFWLITLIPGYAMSLRMDYPALPNESWAWQLRQQGVNCVHNQLKQRRDVSGYWTMHHWQWSLNLGATGARANHNHGKTKEKTTTDNQGAEAATHQVSLRHVRRRSVERPGSVVVRWVQQAAAPGLPVRYKFCGY